MPRHSTSSIPFGGDANMATVKRKADEDLAFTTRGKIRPLREYDFGRKTDGDIYNTIADSRQTADEPIRKNTPPDNREQVPPTRRKGSASSYWSLPSVGYDEMKTARKLERKPRISKPRPTDRKAGR